MEEELIEDIENLEIVDVKKKPRRRPRRKNAEKANTSQFTGEIFTRDSASIGVNTNPDKGIEHITSEMLTVPVINPQHCVIKRRSISTQSENKVEGLENQKPINKSNSKKKNNDSQAESKKVKKFLIDYEKDRKTRSPLQEDILNFLKKNGKDYTIESETISATAFTDTPSSSTQKKKDYKIKTESTITTDKRSTKDDPNKSQLNETPGKKKRDDKNKNLSGFRDNKNKSTPENKKMFGDAKVNNSFNSKSKIESPSSRLPKKRRLKDNKDKEPSQPLKFEPYLKLQQVEAGLKDGTLVKGIVRINPRYYTDAYVSREDRKLQDYYIGSVVDRNRALEGDKVVLKIYPEEEWVDGQIRAKVVYILTKVHPRLAVGFLTTINDSGRRIPSFQPRDKRVPFMNVSLHSLPQDFFKNPKKYEGVLFMAAMVDWQNPKFANGILKEVVGMVNDLKSESKGILLENELFFPDFPENLGRDALIGKKTIPEKEFEFREDFRKECIFTIDPSTAKDLDDAVSCKRLTNGNFEIGVHIADVTYYLTEGTELDKLVSQRATSVYLIDKVCHMLPIELTSTCSLLPGKDCLTFSVIIEMTPDGEVINKRFTRSVINSCCKLAYEHAQDVIETQGANVDDSTSETIRDISKDDITSTDQENTTDNITSKPQLVLKYDTKEFPEIGNNFTRKQIATTVLTLHSLAQKMRQKRIDAGALRLDQIKVGFSLSSSLEPEDYFVQEIKDANRMIEEFMLLANMVVAERIYEAYPKLAFLRCHIPPIQRMMNEVKEMLECVGIFLQIDSSKGLHESLVKYSAGDFGFSRSVVLYHLLSKPMQRATYFCTNGCDPDSFHHYALSVPFYTHFTSPIRRYADVMVHRLLSSAMGYTPDPKWCPDEVQQIANICNKQKYNAKRAGEASCELYLAYFIDNHQPFISDAVVVSVYDKSFDAIPFSTGSVVRLYINNVDKGVQVQTECNECNGKKLWKLWFLFPPDGAENSTPIVQAVDLFQVIRISLKRKPKTNKLDAQLLRPPTVICR